MTKIDYILVAEILNKYFKSGNCWPTDDLVNLVKALAHGFEQNNSRFQWAKFMSAVYDDLPCGEEWKYRIFNIQQSEERLQALTVEVNLAIGNLTE